MVFLKYMPIRGNIFIPQGYYHTFNRGTEKRKIFLKWTDYSNFLGRLKKNLKKFDVTLLCFCLMPNHFHFLLRQNTEKSISNFLNCLLLGYAKYFNIKYERVGPLFQGRFKAKMIQTDEYLLQASKYINRNPLELINSGNPTDSRNFLKRNFLKNYIYSSYGDYLGIRRHDFVDTKFILGYFSKTNRNLSYQSFVEETEVSEEIFSEIGF